MIGETSGIGNGLFGPETSGVGRCAGRNRGCRSIVERGAEEVCPGTNIRGQFALDTVRRHEPRIDMARIGMGDVERRYDFADHARLRHIDYARNATFGTIGEGSRGAVVNDNRDFTRIARDIR